MKEEVFRQVKEIAINTAREWRETKHIRNILHEMCNRVNADYGSIDFKAPTWYHEYEWTQEQEDDFVKWMTDYLFNNKEARFEILAFPRKDKKYCKKAAEEFVWNYGWKIKEGKDV